MNSLRFKILAPFLLGSLALTIFLAWYTYKSAQQAVTDAALLISKAQTENIYNSMSILFRSMSTSVEKMSTDPHIANLFIGPQEMEGMDTSSWLDILIHGNEYYRNILIVDKDGVCIASNSQMQIGVSYASRPHVQAALKGETLFSEFSIGLRTKTLSATVASPIYINSDIVGAVVLVNDFPNIVQYADAGESGVQAVFSAILDPSGHFVAHKNPELCAKTKHFPDLYSQLATTGINGGNVEYTFDNDLYLGYAQIEPTTGWIIVSSAVKSRLFKPADQLGLIVLGVSVLALLVILFLVVRTINGILGTLFSLIGYAKKVSEGDLTAKLADSTRDDELDILHGSLQSMVQSMREMLIQSQEASKLKSEFLANMSHEIRTPLNAVIGMAHLYLTSEDEPEEKRHYISKIQVAAQSLLGIINDILDISKIEAGMFSLDHTLFNLREIIGRTLMIHQEGAAAKGLSLEMSYCPDAPELFIGDPVRIGQILNNLTGNAVKFSEKGAIRIHCGLAPEQTDDGRACLKISVTDTGIGMTPEQMAILFSPFMQADASITRRFGGTGLGLAISDKIVKMMDGNFEVSSTPDVGSAFSFTMCLETAPPDEEEEQADGPVDFTQLQLSGKSILIAEDNEFNQLIMRDMLGPTDAEVVIVENGLLAVEAVMAKKFDLIFMDMQMPVMDGIQASKTIRALAGAGGIPIVAVTANAMKEDKEKGFEAGLNDYITKPIDFAHLFRVLKKWT